MKIKLIEKSIGKRPYTGIHFNGTVAMADEHNINHVQLPNTKGTYFYVVINGSPVEVKNGQWVIEDEKHDLFVRYHNEIMNLFDIDKLCLSQDDVLKRWFHESAERELTDSRIEQLSRNIGVSQSFRSTRVGLMLFIGSICDPKWYQEEMKKRLRDPEIVELMSNANCVNLDPESMFIKGGVAYERNDIAFKKCVRIKFQLSNIAGLVMELYADTPFLSFDEVKAKEWVNKWIAVNLCGDYKLNWVKKSDELRGV